MRSRASIWPASGRTGSTTRRRARRSAAGPSSSSAGSAASRSRSAGIPATGGPTLPTSTGSSFASRFRARRSAKRSRRGELDVASHFPPGFVAELQQESALRVLSNQRAAGWDHFEIRIGPGGHPALGNKLVRRALAYGIDRAAIVEQILRATDRSASQRDSAVFPTRSPHYRKNWESYRYRPAEARRLLEQAGCRRGADGIYVCAGSRLSLRFVTTVPPGGFRPRVIELVQAQLRQAGIEVVPSFATTSAIFNQILASGDFDVALFSWISTPGASAKAIFGCGGEQNYTGYCQRLVTADLDQAERILDARPAGACPEQGRPADGEGRARDPALPANPVGRDCDRRCGTSACRSTRSSPRSGMRRTGGSRIRASRGARRLAPRRLGRGRLRARRHRAGAARSSCRRWSSLPVSTFWSRRATVGL